MTHCYEFVMFETPTYTSCAVTYTGYVIIPKDVLRKIATTVIEQATLIWIRGNDSCLNEAINMSVLKEYLNDVGDTEMLPWLLPFDHLDMDNRYNDITQSGFNLRFY